MARGCFVGLFLQGVAPAGHWNGSRDGGGAWRPGTWQHWQGFFRAKGRWAGGVRKPQNLVGVGTVVRFRAGGNREQPGWLRRLPISQDSSGSYLNDSYGSLLIQPFRTRMGPLNRIAPANTWQACRRPWGACQSAADAYLTLTRKYSGIAVFY